MRQKEAAKMYSKELWGSVVAYVLILFVAIRIGRPMEPGVIRTVIMVSPMVGFLLMIWSIARQFKRMDEYMRQVQLEALAISAAVTAGATFTYGFLETAGFPKLSMFTVWPVLCGTWGLVVCYRKWREK